MDLLTTGAPTNLHKIKSDVRLRTATYNVRSMIHAGKREMLELWAKKNNIDIVLLQETRINLAGVERRKHYTFFPKQKEARLSGVLTSLL